VDIYKIIQGVGVLRYDVLIEYKATCILLTITRARDIFLLEGDRRGEGIKALADDAIFVAASRETHAAVAYAEGEIAAINAQNTDRRPTSHEEALLARYSDFVRGRARAENAQLSSRQRSSTARHRAPRALQSKVNRHAGPGSRELQTRTRGAAQNFRKRKQKQRQTGQQQQKQRRRR
jgi:hypothetical protein